MERRLPKPQGDNEDVVRSASMLQVSEFELFRLAYQSWFGQTPTELQLTQAFDDYMMRNKVPMWVRSFARQIERLQAEGRLDRTCFGLESLPATGVWTRLIGVSSMLGIILFIGMLVYWAYLAQDYTTRGCQLPPCY